MNCYNLIFNLILSKLVLIDNKMTIFKKDALEFLLYGIDEINKMEKLINEVLLFKKLNNNIFL